MRDASRAGTRRPSRGCTSPDIDAAAEPVAALVEAGATRGRADGRAGAAPSRAWTHRRHARGLAASFRIESAALLVEFGGRRRGDARRSRRATRARSSSGRELSRAARSRATREQIERRVARARRHVRAVRPPAPAGHVADHRGRLRAARRGSRSAPQTIQEMLASTASSPASPGHASAGNLHFQLTPDFDEPARPRALRGVHGSELVALVIDKYDGSLKAEHGTGRNMAPFVEREWGAKATEMMWRIKALADPDGVLAPGVGAQPRPRHPPARPQVDAGDRGRSATQCVECGFCEPVCPSRNADDDAAPADRPAPRAGAPGADGSPVAAALMARIRARRDRHLRGRRLVRDRLPAGDRHRATLVKGLRAANRRAQRARSRGARRRRRLGARRVGGPRRAARAAAGRAATASPRGSAARRPLRDAAGPSGSRVDGADAAGRRPADCRPPTARGAAAVYLPACVNRIFATPPGPSGAELPEALVRGVGPRRRAAVDPARRRRTLLRDAVDLQGLRARRATRWRRDLEPLRRWTDGGLLPLVIDAELVRARAARARRPARARAARPRRGAVGPRRATAGAATAAQLARVAVHPTLLDAPARSRGRAARDRARSGRRGRRASRRDVLRHGRRPRPTCIPTCPPRRCADETDELGADGRFDAHLCGNRTCEIALRRTTGADYTSPVVLLDELTR